MGKGRRYKSKYINMYRSEEFIDTDYTRKRRLENRRKKAKRKFTIILILLILIVCVFQLSFLKENETVMAIDENEEIAQEEAQNNEGDKTIEEETEKLEPIEDEKVKEYISTVINENGLSENNFAFFYYNLDEQKYYFYNENKWFTAASTVKVPIAMLYYDKVANGEINMETTYVYGEDDYEEGDGMTAYTYDVGDSIPLDFLITEMIEKSDNTATNILTSALGGRENYIGNTLNYLEEEILLPDNFYDENVTCAKYAYGILKYLYENSEKYTELIEHMKLSSYGEYLKEYIDYDVAHKYGSYEGCVHDYGIVYGKTNYLIGVFTEDVQNAKELIATVSKGVLDVNEKNIQ